MPEDVVSLDSDRVVSCPASQSTRSRARLRASIVSSARPRRVCSRRAAGEAVVTDSAGQPAVARSAEQPVVARIAVQLVVTAAAPLCVVAAASADDVTRGPPAEMVVGDGAAHHAGVHGVAAGCVADPGSGAGEGCAATVTAGSGWSPPRLATGRARSPSPTYGLGAHRRACFLGPLLARARALPRLPEAVFGVLMSSTRRSPRWPAFSCSTRTSVRTSCWRSRW